MVEDIAIKITRPPQRFGQYPTTHTIHRIAFTRDPQIAISLCGKRFRPRNVWVEMARDDDPDLCKFCERLAPS